MYKSTWPYILLFFILWGEEENESLGHSGESPFGCFIHILQGLHPQIVSSHWKQAVPPSPLCCVVSCWNPGSPRSREEPLEIIFEPTIWPVPTNKLLFRSFLGAYVFSISSGSSFTAFNSIRCRVSLLLACAVRDGNEASGEVPPDEGFCTELRCYTKTASWKRDIFPL